MLYLCITIRNKSIFIINNNMKKILALIVLLGITTSFKSDKSYPCHAFGDMGVCTHNQHAYDYDYYGNVYPCTHKLHAYDVYPCTHYCY